MIKRQQRSLLSFFALVVVSTKKLSRIDKNEVIVAEESVNYNADIEAEGK